MITVVTWETAHLYGESWISHHRLRHRVFVDRQGWTVPTHNGLEYDQFDTPSAVYMLWLDHQGLARGVVRLLPTERPYMIQTLWPELVAEGPLPACPTVWEATRIGVDRDLPPALRDRIVGELVAGCLEYGLDHGIGRYLCVMPPAAIRATLTRSGCPSRALGAPAHLGDHPVIAAEIPITAEALASVRQRRALTASVLAAPAAAVPLAA